MASKKSKRYFGLKKWLLRRILGKQCVYVIYICLYKSKMEAELIGNHIRRDFIEEIMEYFDTKTDA